MKIFKLWLAPLILLLLAVVIQTHLYLDWDVIWLVRESQTFIHGGRFVKDFFDPNQPMILYLYSPIALLISVTDWSLITVTRSYTFVLALFSMGLCWMQIKKMIPPEKTLPLGILLAGIAFTFFLLPIQEFAQREHFLLILTLPYLLSTATHSKQPQRQKIVFGVLAGIGFCLKLYFLLLLILAELALVCRQKKISALFRTETLAIALVIITYLVSILWHTPEYYQIVFPFVLHFYVGYATLPRQDLLINLFTLNFLIALIPAYYTLMQQTQKALITVFIAAAFGGALVFLIAAETWYYHLIPLFGFTTLLLFVLLGRLLENQRRSIAFYSVFLICLLNLLFSLLWVSLGSMNSMSLPKDKEYTPTLLITYIKQHPKINSLFSFSTHPGVSTTVSEYTKKRNCSRFTGFWMMPSLAKKMKLPYNNRLINAIHYVRQTVADDFQRCQPDLVVVDTEKNKMYFSGSFNYLDFFMQNKRFKNSWQNYHLAKKIPGFSLYLRKGLNGK